MADLHVGTSGWSYDHWTGVLYDPGLPPARRLARYVDAFGTVEVNATFYRWPRATTFARWREQLPAGFRFTVKAPRGLTHARRLADPQVWVERITEGWRELGDRAGVLLLQLPPAMSRDDGRLDAVLGCLPPDIPVAVEFRHPSWHVPEVFGLLERHGAAYCVMSGAHLPCVLRVTAGFAYVRLHGPSHDWLYAGSYSDDDLSWWADRVREWQGAGTEVWAYFNNDGDGNAVRDAWRLRERLGP